MDKRNFVIVVVILIMAAIVSVSSYLPSRQAHDTVSVSAFPMRVGEWVGRDIALDQKIYDLLETKNLVMRNYTRPDGVVINLYIVYSQTNRKVAHPPEICMQGDGAQVLSKTDSVVIGKIAANKLILSRGESREMVFYWYKAGTSHTASYLQQQLQVSWERLFRKNVSTAMIRVYMPFDAKGEDATREMLSEFIRTIAPLLDVYLP
jgi:EpsI family protein